MTRVRRPSGPKDAEALRHDHATRRNIPTAEFQSIMRDEDKSPVRLAHERRNRDREPQLVWRGKDEQDWSDLVVHAPPLYLQEKIRPKALIDDLVRETAARRAMPASTWSSPAPSISTPMPATSRSSARCRSSRRG